MYRILIWPDIRLNSKNIFIFSFQQNLATFFYRNFTLIIYIFKRIWTRFVYSYRFLFFRPDIRLSGQISAFKKAGYPARRISDTTLYITIFSGKPSHELHHGGYRQPLHPRRNHRDVWTQNLHTGDTVGLLLFSDRESRWTRFGAHDSSTFNQ